MKFSIYQNNLNDWQGASLIFGVFEENIESQLNNLGFAIDPDLLQKKIIKNNFKGEQGKILNFEFLDHRLENLIILGLGETKELKNDDIKKHIANIIRKIIDKNEKISILLPWESLKTNQEINLIAESARLSAFKDNRFNSKRNEKNILKEIEFLNLNQFENINFKETENICEGIELARRLVAAPPNSLTPLEMSIQASQIANDHNLEIKILEKKDCEDLGMGAYLAVAKGSDLEPKFIHLTLKSEGAPKKRLRLLEKV